MGTKTVIIEVATVEQDFPLGTVVGEFLFELIYAQDNAPASSVSQSGTTATFPLVQDGIPLIARVTRNGVSIQQEFTIPRENETIAVPSSFTIRFE